MLLIIAYYIISMSLCCFINAINVTELPKSFGRFLILTFLPYLLFMLISGRIKQLRND